MTAATVVRVETDRLDIGWVVRGTLRVLRRRSLDLLIVGTPFVLIPGVLVGFLPDSSARAANAVTSLPALLFTGAASLITYGELSGRGAIGAGPAIGKAANRFASLWGVGILSGLAVLLGGLLLIVPGVIALAGLMGASSACIVENLRTYAALDRSWQLSRGSLWHLAALAGLGLSVTAVIVALYFGVALVLFNALDDALATALATFVLGPLFGLTFYAVVTVGSAAAYAGLRRAKEGSAGDIATVFD